MTQHVQSYSHNSFNNYRQTLTRALWFPLGRKHGRNHRIPFLNWTDCIMWTVLEFGKFWMNKLKRRAVLLIKWRYRLGFVNNELQKDYWTWTHHLQSCSRSHFTSISSIHLTKTIVIYTETQKVFMITCKNKFGLTWRNWQKYSNILQTNVVLKVIIIIIIIIIISLFFQ